MAAEKIYVSIERLCELKNLKAWRVYDMTRKGEMPVRHLMGRPVMPYQIDLHEFEKLESTAMPRRRQRSLKIKETRIHSGHGKEQLWPK